jgi:sodium transport system permease protein
MNHPILVIWFKELLDTLRDRRTLVAMIIAPILLTPLLVVLPQRLLAEQRKAQENAVVKVAVAGAEHAPALIESLRASRKVEVIESSNPEEAIRARRATIGLIIPEGFEASLAQGQIPEVSILSDQSKFTQSLQAARVEILVRAYTQTIVAQRLTARGVDVGVLTPFKIDSQNIASAQQMGGAFLAMMLPMFIVLWGLVGGMYTAIDVTAGEKERLTLEPLLVSPTSRTQIVLGKLLAIVATSFVSLALSVLSMLVAFQIAPPDYGAGAMSFSVAPQTVLLILLAAFPITLMFGALEIAICLFARSFKEGQNYIVPLQFVVIIPAMAIMFLPDLALPAVTYTVPIFGAVVILRDLLLDTARAPEFGIMLGSSVVYAALCVALAVYQFRQERVLFRTIQLISRPLPSGGRCALSPVGRGLG